MRIRQDYEYDRKECIGSPDMVWTNMKPLWGKCVLPYECKLCQRWVCNACEKTVSWGDGCADGAPGLCDDCWVKFIGDWCDEEEDMEKERMKKYEQACVL